MSSSPRPAGYAELVRRLKLDVIPNWHESFVASVGAARRTWQDGGRTIETYPAKHWPGDAAADHFEFALKYDGTNLLILKRAFLATGPDEITRHVRATPNGKFARRLWYLYEWLTGERLPIADLTQNGYVDLLERGDYFTSRGIARKRQRVRDNALGDASFCPSVRRTPRLVTSEASDVADRCRALTAHHAPDVLRRALSYLYTKESKSSFAIEDIEPDASRTERFVTQLQLAEREDFFAKPRLIELQNRIVDARFRDADYRATQNYVGESVSIHDERVHYVSPKPQDLAGLMEGMFAAHRRMERDGVHPVVQAGTIAYGFVFMHPFEDGNGRIHRFLIHNVLARRGYTPPGLMFPVSAVMLKRRERYDRSLETFSAPLMPLVEYDLDDAGRMTVGNETADHYRYIDMTEQVEALFEFIEETIRTELPDELRFLDSYDRAREAVQEIVDMPDRLIRLCIRLCLQNKGTLSAAKRGRHFAALTDDEIARIERAVAVAYAAR